MKAEIKSNQRNCSDRLHVETGCGRQYWKMSSKAEEMLCFEIAFPITPVYILHRALTAQEIPLMGLIGHILVPYSIALPGSESQPCSQEKEFSSCPGVT